MPKSSLAAQGDLVSVFLEVLQRRSIQFSINHNAALRNAPAILLAGQGLLVRQNPDLGNCDLRGFLIRLADAGPQTEYEAPGHRESPACSPRRSLQCADCTLREVSEIVRGCARGTSRLPPLDSEFVQISISNIEAGISQFRSNPDFCRLLASVDVPSRHILVLKPSGISPRSPRTGVNSSPAHERDTLSHGAAM